MGGRCGVVGSRTGWPDGAPRIRRAALAARDRVVAVEHRQPAPAEELDHGAAEPLAHADEGPAVRIHAPQGHRQTDAASRA
jgi:hypothetical protein